MCLVPTSDAKRPSAYGRSVEMPANTRHDRDSDKAREVKIPPTAAVAGRRKRLAKGSVARKGLIYMSAAEAKTRTRLILRRRAAPFSSSESSASEEEDSVAQSSALFIPRPYISRTVLSDDSTSTTLLDLFPNLPE